MTILLYQNTSINGDHGSLKERFIANYLMLQFFVKVAMKDHTHTSNIRTKIEQNLNRAHEKATKTYNTRAKAITFKLGQEVFLKNRNLSNFSKAINAKFNPKYLKCRVRNKIGNSFYELEDLKGKYIGKFHASDIKT